MHGDRLEALARLGFAARGLVYLLVGWFALQAAMHGGRPADSRNALSSLADGGAGRFLLVLVALGLVAYGVWRLLDAVAGRHGHDGKETAVRAGHAVSGVAHLLLGLFAGSLALRGRAGAASGSQDESARDWTGWLLAQPFGEALVMLVGAVLIGVGIYQWVKVYRGDFMRHLGGDAPPAAWIRPAGRLGFAARGLVFALLGLFLLDAARQHDPSEAGGMGQALATLQAQPNGPLLLGITALGLLLFGLFSLVEARYRRVDVPDVGGRLRGV